ncbi:MAG: glycosyltransferase family 2 protein [Prevotella sp.]|nr:glycosyltransferase family 2 protein [Prevotella sp.]
MKLSIVIPVYRTEATLDRCVKSVLTQDLADFEVILVDDGSPDQCPARCDAWAAHDKHVRVVHQANGGLSDARNAGIRLATGDYITFVDSDDFIAAETYRPLMRRLEQTPDTDILEYPVFVHYGAPLQQLLDMQPETTYHDMEAYWLDGQAYQHTYACNKLFRRSLFTEVCFPIGRVFEDAYTLPLLLRKTGTVQMVSLGCYFYCSNNQGITQTADGQALRMLLEPHVEMLDRIHRKDRSFQTYYLHVLNIQLDVYEQTGEAPILPQTVLKPAHFIGSQKLKAITLNILGINTLCKLNKLIHKLWRNR